MAEGRVQRACHTRSNFGHILSILIYEKFVSGDGVGGILSWCITLHFGRSVAPFGPRLMFARSSLADFFGQQISNF